MPHVNVLTVVVDQVFRKYQVNIAMGPHYTCNTPSDRFWSTPLQGQM